jgi:hypothetical protein
MYLLNRLGKYIGSASIAKRFSAHAIQMADLIVWQILAIESLPQL